MSAVCYVSCNASCPSDDHGNSCCPHSVTGPAVSGSPNVFIHGQPVLRVGDAGTHSACCGANSWVAAEGSSTVFVNGIPVVRVGDKTSHCGGSGAMISGSGSVFVGE